MIANNFKKISIIIVVYNSSSIIFNLLKNLINFEIIIVDNGGNTHIIEKLKSYKNIKIISKGKNIGYGNGINFAFKYINTEYFFVLNPDIVIEEHAIIKLINIITKEENCAVLAPLISTDLDSFGIFPEKGKNIERNQNENKSTKILEEMKLSGPCCVDVTKGCALLIKSEHFRTINMFDEKFFLFWEEIDLCRKFRKEKLSIIVTPEIKAFHKEGSSAKNSLATYVIRTYHLELSPLIYFNVDKLQLNIYWKIIKYFFRAISYLLILNFKNSLKNFLKLLATINYILFK